MNVNFVALLCREFRVYFQPLLHTVTFDTNGKTTADLDAIKGFFKSVGYDLEPVIKDAEFWDEMKAIDTAIVEIAEKLKHITPLVKETIASINFPNDIKDIPIVLKELPQDTKGVMDLYDDLKPHIDQLSKGFKSLTKYCKDLIAIPGKPELTDALKRLPQATLNALTYRYLCIKHPAIMPALEFLTLATWGEQKKHKFNDKVIVIENLAPSFHPARLKNLFGDPNGWWQNTYWPGPDGFGTSVASVNVVARKLFTHIQAILDGFGANTTLGLPQTEMGVIYPANVNPQMKERMEGVLTWEMPIYVADQGKLIRFGAMIGLLVPDTADQGPGVFILPFGDFAFNVKRPPWIFSLTGPFATQGLKINKDGISWLDTIPPAASLQFSAKPQPGKESYFILGTGSHIEIGSPAFNASFKQINNRADFGMFIDLASNKIILANPGGNDFLGNFLPDSVNGVVTTFGFGVGWSNQKGFYIDVTSSTVIEIKLDLTLFHLLHLEKIKLSLQTNQVELVLAASIELPRSVFQPLLPDGSIDQNNSSKINFEIGGLWHTDKAGFSLSEINSSSFTKSAILNTGFTLELKDVKLDLSRTQNIPEAIADGRPADFVGVYMEKASIEFPKSWQHSDADSKGELFVEKLLAGTGGISGTIGLKEKDGVKPEDAFISVRFGNNFTVSLTKFSMEFRQNAVLKTDIEGRLDLPGFKDADDKPVQIDIKIHFDHNGDFYITAKEEDGIDLPLHLEKFLTVSVKSLTVGRRSGKFFVALNGSIGFNTENTGGNSLLSGFLPKNIEVQKLLIWENGQIELEGGVVTLAKPIKLNLGPAKLTVTALGMGSHERMHGGKLRKYKYVEFSAGLSVSPGGVDARGDGIKVYFTCDTDKDNGKPFDLYLRIQSISIDLIIPGSASKDQATLLLNGYLSMKEPTNKDSDAGTEYAGGIDFKLPKMKMGGSAEMRYNPKVPSFLIDVSLEISTPIVLGATGMGIYGFRALFGKRYIASKTEAPVSLPADAEWWQYYKKKVPPKPREGITASKMANLPGFSFGAGVSLATATDGGQSFSSKVFFLLSLPDVFLLQGQAQILKGRIGLDTDTDPPFYCLIAIDKTSISSAMGVSYKIPDDGDKPGSIVTVDALIEMAYFWRDSRAWYLNIGREQPVDRRVRGRIFDLFDVYSYFMLNASGIRAGAGASLDKELKFGPVKAGLHVYMDTAGRLSFKPLQIGGSIKIGGNLEGKVCGVGFTVVVAASLAAEAPKPFIVTGQLDACVKALKKEYCLHLDFTWTFKKMLNLSEVEVVSNGYISQRSAIPAVATPNNNLQSAVKALNMMSFEPRELMCFDNISMKGINNSVNGMENVPGPEAWTDPEKKNDEYIIPMDSFIDIEFRKPVNPNSSDPSLLRLGGVSAGAEFTEYVAPQRGKSDRVRHDYRLNEVQIFYWDNAWKPYNVYEALIAGLKKPPFNLTAQEESDLLQKGQYGFWQIDNPGRYTKLRLLAQNPLSFLRQGTGDTIPEELGTGNGIFCAPPPRRKTCVNFDTLLLLDPQGNAYFKEKKVPGNQIAQHLRVLFRIMRNDGELLQKPNSGLRSALSYAGADTLELYLPEPSAEVSLLAGTTTNGLTIKYFARRQRTGLNPLSGKVEPVLDPAGLPVFDYLLVRTVVKNPAELTDPIPYQDLDNPVDKIEITGKVPGISEKTNLYCEASISSAAKALMELLNLISTKALGLMQDIELMKDPYQTVARSVFPNFPAESSLVYSPQVGVPGSRVRLMENILTIQFKQDGGPVFCQVVLTDPTGMMNTDMWRQPGVWRFRNLRPDSAGAVQGANSNFLVDVEMPSGTSLTLQGQSTCFPVFNCYDRYLNFFYQICYLTQADAVYNQNLPVPATVQQNNQMMALAINKTLWPVWRPNTAFAIRVEYTDKVYQESSWKYDYNRAFAICFKTKGPVGHYHEYINDAGTDSIPLNSYSALEKLDQEDAFKLSRLQHYIDFPKSYPNADGNILNAKPLYYGNPELRLFYIYPHVYQFYQDWEPYNGLPKVGSALEVLIKDPAEVLLVPVPDPDSPGSVIMKPYDTPLAVNQWQKDILPASTPGKAVLYNFPVITPDIAALNNMVNNGITSQNPCLPAPTPFKPPGIYNLVKPNPTAPLEPLKLYTAIYNAAYQPGSLPRSVREVHRYGFQTSRYKDFAEHIRSYILYDDPTTKNIEKAAVYRIDLLFKNAENDYDPVPVLRAQQVLDKTLHASDTLHTEAALDFDKIIDRLFALNGLEPAENVQFNVLCDLLDTKHHPSGKILGILVRSPEPFNDPKTPANELASTLRMLPTQNVKPGITYFKTYFSKNNSSAFITNANNSMDVPRGKYAFDFEYKLFNGQTYEIQAKEQLVIDFTTL